MFIICYTFRLLHEVCVSLLDNSNFLDVPKNNKCLGFVSIALFYFVLQKISMSGYGILDGTNSGVSSDLFMRNVDYFDFPMESLEGDDLNGGYWDAKLQSLVPILSEVLAGSSLPSGGYIGSAASVIAPSLSDPVSSLFYAPLKRIEDLFLLKPML